MSDTPTHADGNVLIHLKVGGKYFVLDRGDIESFRSEFLSKLVTEDSPFQQPGDGIYVVEADPQWFSAFLHFARSGDLPCVVDESKREAALVAADFWGIRDRISKKFGQHLEFRRECYNQGYSKGYTIKSLEQQVVESKKHHNFRRDDGCGRIYCVDCDNRDIGLDLLDYGNVARPLSTRFHTCNKCNCEIYYKPNLDWCHKCQWCKSCQEYSGCPAANVLSRCVGLRPSTADKEAELAEARSRLFV